jgi:hypothetical protein
MGGIGFGQDSRMGRIYRRRFEVGGRCVGDDFIFFPIWGFTALGHYESMFCDGDWAPHGGGIGFGQDSRMGRIYRRGFEVAGRCVGDDFNLFPIWGFTALGHCESMFCDGDWVSPWGRNWIWTGFQDGQDLQER